MWPFTQIYNYITSFFDAPEPEPARLNAYGLAIEALLNDPVRVAAVVRARLQGEGPHPPHLPEPPATSTASAFPEPENSPRWQPIDHRRIVDPDDPLVSPRLRRRDRIMPSLLDYGFPLPRQTPSPSWQADNESLSATSGIWSDRWNEATPSPAVESPVQSVSSIQVTDSPLSVSSEDLSIISESSATLYPDATVLSRGTAGPQYTLARAVTPSAVPRVVPAIMVPVIPTSTTPAAPPAAQSPPRRSGRTVRAPAMFPGMVSYGGSKRGGRS